MTSKNIFMMIQWVRTETDTKQNWQIYFKMVKVNRLYLMINFNTGSIFISND